MLASILRRRAQRHSASCLESRSDRRHHAPRLRPGAVSPDSRRASYLGGVPGTSRGEIAKPARVRPCGGALSACARSSGIVSKDAQIFEPSLEPVCMLKSPLPSSIKYSIVGKISASKNFYGSVEGLLPLMAQDARRMGADAIIHMETGQKIGPISWARPVGSGIAVRIENKADLNCVALGGFLR